MISIEDVPGVGVSIAEKIVELLKTGKLKSYAQLTKEFPEKMLVLTEVPGIGPKTAELLYKKLKIDSIDKLARAAKSGVIEKLPHFKKQSVSNILRGIEQFHTRTKERNRMVLTTAGPIAEDILDFLKKNKMVKKCEAVGSLRRMKETIGDIDIVVATADPKKIIDYFSKASFVKNILAKGDTKISVIHRKDIRVDLEILPERTYGSLLQHFTGSKEHNVHLRTWASAKGLKISEYGITKKGKVYNFT
ncbi:MAG: type-X family DNA polymerase, partial [Candidatus Parcubacteria bacterium]|nr:type-X family DNA polymerase [Candidatus Parcubacteria bacterium]